MKNLIILTIAALLFAGCVSEKKYLTGKVVYKGSKALYLELPNESNKLRVLDKVAVTVDTARTSIKDEIAVQNSKKKENVSSLEAINK